MSGDRAVVSVLVKVDRPEAFRVFTEEIDRWWRAGLKFRRGPGRSVVHLEPRVGGRLFEAFGETVIETGVVTVFDPPSQLELKWRAANFAPDESTHLAVRFEEQPSGTLVTVTHSQWSSIRDDHPVRHGQTPAAFVRTLGLWWGDQLTSLRQLVTTA